MIVIYGNQVAIKDIQVARVGERGQGLGTTETRWSLVRQMTFCYGTQCRLPY